MANELNVNSGTRRDSTEGFGIDPVSGPLSTRSAPVRQGELVHAEEPRGQRANARAWPGNRVMLGLGRAIFGGYFLYNGINHFKNRQMLTEYARAKHVSAPEVAVSASGAMLLLGGVSVLTGVQPKIGASLIAAFLLGVSPQMHGFWQIDDQEQKMHEFVNFTKNMALVGAACFVAALPEPWPGSVQPRAALRS